jgi:hypothetical protein
VRTTNVAYGATQIARELLGAVLSAVFYRLGESRPPADGEGRTARSVRVVGAKAAADPDASGFFLCFPMPQSPMSACSRMRGSRRTFRPGSYVRVHRCSRQIRSAFLSIPASLFFFFFFFFFFIVYFFLPPALLRIGRPCGREEEEEARVGFGNPRPSRSVNIIRRFWLASKFLLASRFSPRSFSARFFFFFFFYFLFALLASCLNPSSQEIRIDFSQSSRAHFILLFVPVPWRARTPTFFP